MPVNASRITLVLPGFRAVFAQREQRLPCLEKLVSRGSGLQALNAEMPRASLEPWQQTVLHALSIDAELPSAALSWFGAQGAPAQPGTWLHLDPVHFAISIDGLALHSVPSWSQAELNALEPALRAYCEQAGFTWHRCGEQVFLHSSSALAIETVALHAATDGGLRNAQPQGKGARELIQLSTELQMVLHEHPSQRRRIAGGQLPINALWLWGAGELPTVSTHSLPSCWSNSAYVRGIYRLQGANCQSQPVSLAVVAKHTQQEVLLVASVDTASEVEQHWFAPLLQGLRNGVWRSARIYMDDLRLDVGRSQLLRVWRRARELTELRT